MSGLYLIILKTEKMLGQKVFDVRGTFIPAQEVDSGSNRRVKKYKNAGDASATVFPLI